MTSQNSNLSAAKTNKNDEFYTQLTDIEKEMSHYRSHFKNKIIFCNCDDPEVSNFWKFFSLNFEFFGLKKLISTHYEVDKASYKLEMYKDINGDGSVTQIDTIKTPLKQNGDFRSPESIEILKESDIVVTNPPFSLFREYIAQLVEHDKKFIIVGSQNAVTCKEIFSLIKDNKLWLGVDNGGIKWFEVPEDYEIASQSRIRIENGKKYFSLGNVAWFTNLDTSKRHDDIILYKKYSEEEYPTYINYDAINVDKIADIPMDYAGNMGVPITFLDKFNPDQFEIVGLAKTGSMKFNKVNPVFSMKNGDAVGKEKTASEVYRKYNPATDKKAPAYKDSITGELYTSVYVRIIIRNKNPQV